MHTVMVLTAGLLLFFIAEALMIRHWRRKVRVRIHINGTRGKSSVTRYITAALRDSGLRVVGKVTGVVPTFILPDGTCVPVRRWGPARVQEQFTILRRAAALHSDAVVFECMSVNPALQSLEARVLRPTVSVLTNILDDHREEFGSSPQGWLHGLCSFLPERGVLVSGERRYAEEVRALAAERGTRVVSDLPAVQEPLSPEIVEDNVALALSVCDEIGIDHEKARAAIMQEAVASDPYRMTLRGATGTVIFLNGFAVNDVPSAQAFLDRCSGEGGPTGYRAVLLNTRADRPLRTLEFARWCAGIPLLNSVILTGTHVPAARAALRRAGLTEEKIIAWPARQTRDAAETLLRMQLPDGAMVAGVCNINGAGFQILRSLALWSSKHSS